QKQEGRNAAEGGLGQVNRPWAAPADGVNPGDQTRIADGPVGRRPAVVAIGPGGGERRSEPVVVDLVREEGPLVYGHEYDPNQEGERRDHDSGAGDRVQGRRAIHGISERIAES